MSDPTTLGFNLVQYEERDGREVKVWSRHDKANKAKSFLRYEQVELNPYWKLWHARYIRSDGHPIWVGPSFDTLEAAYVHAELNEWGRT